MVYWKYSEDSLEIVEMRESENNCEEVCPSLGNDDLFPDNNNMDLLCQNFEGTEPDGLKALCLM